MYQPRPVPAVLQDIPQFLQQELVNIGRASGEPVAFVQLEKLYAEPSKPREGMVCLADGTTWKPNGTGGAGVWCYYGGSWKLLG